MVTLLALSLLALGALSDGTEDPEYATCDTNLLVIVFDGWPHYYQSQDYQDEFGISTPNIDELIADGVKGVLRPIFPTLTYPNHLTAATGLYPEGHGIVSNWFYDEDLDDWYGYWGDDGARLDLTGKWFQGEAIWQTIRNTDRYEVVKGKDAKNVEIGGELKTAALYNPGSQANVGGNGYATYYTTDIVSDSTTRSRMDNLLDLIGLDEYPFLINYFQEPDDLGHTDGPRSQVVADQLQWLDSFIGEVLELLDDMGRRETTNIILYSDHGFATSPVSDASLLIRVDSSVLPADGEGDYFTIDYRYPTWGFLLNDEDMFSADDMVQLILSAFPNEEELEHVNVYKRDDPQNPFPGYNEAGYHERVPDVFMQADNAYQFVYDTYLDAGTAETMPGVSTAGGHSYSNLDYNMASLFVGSGPAFQSGTEAELSMVHLHSIMAEVMCGGAPGSIKVSPAPAAEKLTGKVKKIFAPQKKK